MPAEKLGSSQAARAVPVACTRNESTNIFGRLGGVSTDRMGT